VATVRSAGRDAGYSIGTDSRTGPGTAAADSRMPYRRSLEAELATFVRQLTTNN
jgi:hypothetical protein